MGDDNPSDFWQRVLKCPRHVAAPMMYHARLFVEDPKYRCSVIGALGSERPLIMQFSANNPDLFGAAAQLARPFCDAVDLNLGCPQGIARSGHYGAYLQTEWDLIKKLLAAGLQSGPVTAKIRIFSDEAKSLQYAYMLQQCGISVLTVHGRTIDQHGQLTGLANWEVIRTIRNVVNIPLIANGNIQCSADVDRCIKQTGCDAVMSAEGILYNPMMFTGQMPWSWDVGLKYIRYVQQLEGLCLSDVAPSYVKGHIHKICRTALQIHRDQREFVQSSETLGQITECMQQLQRRFEEIPANDADSRRKNFKCQPFQRPIASSVHNSESKQHPPHKEENYDFGSLFFGDALSV